uniref:Threonine dehydratase n=1 Tax=uncultured marine crenarchaeote E48-1C TaxID=907718 RepID=G9BAV2_9ARCH|nr:threonine dehydratase [uncultured marine crenarchaeote E48-1C]
MINLEDIEEARETIRNLVKRTPLARSRSLSDLCSGEVYLKLENLQITNSFKIRGALNKMFHLSIEEMKRGVVTASSGNHALAVAIGAEKLNLSAKIVVSKDTPKVKIDKIREHNVELILYGDFYDEAEEKAINLAKKDGLTYISPYNDKMVIAGQGTIGLEILEDLSSVDTVIAPIGGGGLISGISLAVKGIKSNVRVTGVQSEASPVMYESLKAGRIVDAEMRESIADGLFGGIEKGSVTFKIVQKYVDDILLVKEKTIRKAVFLLWKKEEQVVEGAGAVSVAAIMENTGFFMGQDIVAVISGGNIENELFRNILASESDRA